MEEGRGESAENYYLTREVRILKKMRIAAMMNGVVGERDASFAAVDLFRRAETLREGRGRWYEGFTVPPAASGESRCYIGRFIKSARSYTPIPTCFVAFVAARFEMAGFFWNHLDSWSPIPNILPSFFNIVPVKVYIFFTLML